MVVLPTISTPPKILMNLLTAIGRKRRALRDHIRTRDHIRETVGEERKNNEIIFAM